MHDGTQIFKTKEGEGTARLSGLSLGYLFFRVVYSKFSSLSLKVLSFGMKRTLFLGYQVGWVVNEMLYKSWLAIS